ncbi:MBL fold metallo-hydrolase [Paenibacillus endoradicis]|uniref:MBL fold metallo-hydrolase n=1 Tax=Paenibacillus endoradicis TaxID=2972487 RepID=UPI002158EF7D|nr:MBL fold metallo-hydrolase [Paenibacillus endoradicis]MCR8656043.1 MBL fold metallo-hydrolase [Paenibacillus endoradicis]MCR8658369.1 MBL fold metallo-hydrolase [Paenibacillus endoradicis]
MIGTGNAFAKQYYNNNALIQQQSFTLLVDCGITLPHALYEQGFSFNQLDGVLISHIHSDHVGGLESYAFQMMFKYKKKATLYIAESLVEPLWETSLKGGLIQGDLTSIEDYFNVVPLVPNTTYELAPNLHIKLIQTQHIPNKDSYSILFNDIFFYTADMTFNPQLLQQLVKDGVQTIYHDCQLESPGVVHTSLDELLSLPVELQQKIKLMHYGDTIGNYIGKTGLMEIVQQGKPSTM